MTGIVWAATVADAQVGESLWWRSSYSRHSAPERVVVTKRGRTILDVEFPDTKWHTEGRFRMADGTDAKHGPKTGGMPSYVITEATRQLRERLVGIEETASKLGIRRERRILTDEQWEQVVLYATSLGGDQ